MKKLNLCSGKDYRKGWVNMDIRGKCDVKHNANDIPYPFKDNTFDKVICIHGLEHLMGIGTEYSFKTKKDAIYGMEKLTENYASDGKRPPEMSIEKIDGEWVVREFGVKIKNKPWWKFWM